MSFVVVASFENAEKTRCVDIFVRPDGSYGFEEWRREPEDPGTWHRVGCYAGEGHATQAEATAAAKCKVAWFNMAHEAPNWSG